MKTLKEIYFEILGYEITKDEKLAIKTWLQQKQENLNSDNIIVSRDTYTFISECLKEL